MTAEGDRTIVIQGTTAAERIRELVGSEKEDVRSLKGIRAVDVTPDAILVRLHEPVEPEMYPSPDGREVKCLLFRADAAASTAST
jgi:hypothetical protein